MKDYKNWSDVYEVRSWSHFPHHTVDVQNREQAEFRINTILSKMQSLFEDGEVVFHRNHYHHMTHCYHFPAHGDLRH